MPAIKAPCGRFESESSIKLSRLFPPFSTPFFSISGDSTSPVFVSHCISLCCESNFINSPRKKNCQQSWQGMVGGLPLVFDVSDSVIFGPRCAMSSMSLVNEQFQKEVRPQTLCGVRENLQPCKLPPLLGQPLTSTTRF